MANLDSYQVARGDFILQLCFEMGRFIESGRGVFTVSKLAQLAKIFLILQKESHFLTIMQSVDEIAILKLTYHS